MINKPAKENPLHRYSLGLKLRTLRAEKRLTLSRLAAETRLSTALLSKLETDHMVPTLQTLERLCQVYGVSLSYFFTDAAHHSLAITRLAHMSGQGRRHQEAVTITHLHTPTAQSRLIARVLDLPPGAPLAVSKSGARTELFAQVLEGRLQLTTAGMNEVLETGDCAMLDTDEPAVWGALGNAPCKVLSVSAK